jgi:hypothetical protein
MRFPEVYFDDAGMRALTRSAADFGLTSDEILDTVLVTADRLPEEAQEAFVDDVTAALARRLLDKQRT